jgi:glutaminase
LNPRTGQSAPKPQRIRDVLSVMYTCGMYNFAGEWAFEVGVPAKSGVTGGIMAVIPGKLGIGVFSPGLDPQGNSVRGVQVCREFSQRLGLHLLAPEVEDRLLTPPGVVAPG